MPEIHIDVSEDRVPAEEIRFDGAHLSDYTATVGGFRIVLSDEQAGALYRAMRPWFEPGEDEGV